MEVVCIVLFFKQKTAYEMRISDWSSDVCSSDLRAQRNPSPVERRANPSPVERRGNPSSVGRESDGFRRWLYPSYGDLQERPFDRLRTGFSREFLPTVW